MPDDGVVADGAAALAWLKSQPDANGKVGVIGSCSGGRHSVLAASRVPGFAAVVDLWGGGVVMSADQLTPARPVAPIDYTKDLDAPLLGLFGNDDQSPDARAGRHPRGGAQEARQDLRVPPLRRGRARILLLPQPLYRPQQAMDGWAKTFDFFQTHLS